MDRRGNPAPNQTVALRDPDIVMRLQRMGTFHQTRLGFMRSLLRRLKQQRWSFSRPLWRIDEKGVGVAVYTAKGPVRSYSLVCFSHDLDPAKRTDRSIAIEWDATFALFDGVPGDDDIDRLSKQVPKQEAGRVSDQELSLSRANKSARLFEHVVERLAAGRQPDMEKLDAVGYLMRTTAVYGSGKFGTAARDKIAGRAEVNQPFQIEMLSVYFTRAFTVDLAEYLAQSRSAETAIVIDPDLRRRIGVGNSTGLGMAPFLVTHPVLLNNWMTARETALARVRSVLAAGDDRKTAFTHYLARALADCRRWNTRDQRQSARIVELLADLTRLQRHVIGGVLEQDQPWDRLYYWANQHLGAEAQELIVTLIIEPYGDLVDDLLDTMSANEREHFPIDGSMTIGALVEIVSRVYRWAIEIDFDMPGSQVKFWYTSKNKGEPRLGERKDLEEAHFLEMPLAIGRDVKTMMADLAEWPAAKPIAHFLLRHPEHRHTARRVQIAAKLPYSEIRDNLLSAEVLPLDMLRCKLSFFGATKFDPRSDRWTRITMFQNAPFPHELQSLDADDWSYIVDEAAQ